MHDLNLFKTIKADITSKENIANRRFLVPVKKATAQTGSSSSLSAVLLTAFPGDQSDKFVFSLKLANVDCKFLCGVSDSLQHQLSKSSFSFPSRRMSFVSLTFFSRKTSKRKIPIGQRNYVWWKVRQASDVLKFNFYLPVLAIPVYASNSSCNINTFYTLFKCINIIFFYLRFVDAHYFNIFRNFLMVVLSIPVYLRLHSLVMIDQSSPVYASAIDSGKHFLLFREPVKNSVDILSLGRKKNEAGRRFNGAKVVWQWPSLEQTCVFVCWYLKYCCAKIYSIAWLAWVGHSSIAQVRAFFISLFSTQRAEQKNNNIVCDRPSTRSEGKIKCIIRKWYINKGRKY